MDIYFKFGAKTVCVLKECGPSDMKELDQSSDVCFRYYVHHSDLLIDFIRMTQKWSTKSVGSLDDELVNCFCEIRYDCQVSDYWSDIILLLSDNYLLVERGISLLYGMKSLGVIDHDNVFNKKSNFIQLLMNLLFPITDTDMDGIKAFTNISNNKLIEKQYQIWIVELIEWYKCFNTADFECICGLSDELYLQNHMPYAKKMASQLCSLIKSCLS